MLTQHGSAQLEPQPIDCDVLNTATRSFLAAAYYPIVSRVLLPVPSFLCCFSLIPTPL